MVVHSNDKYFQGSDGYEKNRESVVLTSNENNEVALAKLTTSKNPKYKNVPNYGQSKFMTEDLYIKDNEGKFIKISSGQVSNDTSKFVKSNWQDVPIESVEYIKETLFNNSKYGLRNKDRYNKIKKRKS